jgi:hypothetical protein
MKCKVCGAEMSDNNKFCPACGADLREEVIDTAEPAAAKDAGASAQTSQSEPAPPAAAVAAIAPAAVARDNAAASAAPAPRFFDDNLAPIVTTGHWLLTLILLTLLPVVAVVAAGIIGNLVDNVVVMSVLPPVAGLITFLLLVFIWAFNGRTNPSKRNFFRAYLLFILIMIVLTVALALALGSFIMTYMQQMGFTDMNQLLGTLSL